MNGSAAVVRKRIERPFLIGVAGCSGSGKTELATRLSQILPGGADVIQVDSYYYALDHLTPEERSHCNFDHPDSLDWPLLEQHVRDLSEGRAIDMPIYLFAQHTRAMQTVRVEPRPFLIVEGILALHPPELRTIYDLRVFVETPLDECLRRREERDVVERGRTHESVHEQWNATVLPMALEFVIPSRNCADLIVSGENHPEEAVAAVLRHVEDAVTA
jgi:uridine kinase